MGFMRPPSAKRPVGASRVQPGRGAVEGVREATTIGSIKSESMLYLFLLGRGSLVSRGDLDEAKAKGGVRLRIAKGRGRISLFESTVTH
jgi:hypothetical protein